MLLVSGHPGQHVLGDLGSDGRVAVRRLGIKLERRRHAEAVSLGGVEQHLVKLGRLPPEDRVDPSLLQGSEVAVEPPANEFEMAKSTLTSEPKRLIFIAGGIGITPIRAMILHCLRHGKTSFMLYYFTRTPSAMAFRDEFASSGFENKVVLHHDNGDPDQAYDLWPVLEEQRGAHLYCCGPRGLMDAVRDMTGHWPDSAVHFEDFVGASAPHADDKPFEVRLAKSGGIYEVAANVSILDTLRSHGHVLASSCESGTCGTCRCRFVEGEPDHRHLVLSDDEKRHDIMICVSRAKSPTLTLDI